MAEAAPGIRIVIDPKERFYTFEQTLALARRLEDLDIVFEDPFPRDFEAYRRLGRRLRWLSPCTFKDRDR